MCLLSFCNYILKILSKVNIFCQFLGPQLYCILLRSNHVPHCKCGQLYLDFITCKFLISIPAVADMAITLPFWYIFFEA
jgi:hypothetical protein